MSHDPSEIILKCRLSAQETFHIIINVENIFFSPKDFFIIIFFMLNINFETQHLFKLFCNIIKLFHVSFDQLNIDISLKKKNLPQTFVQISNSSLSHVVSIHTKN